jgi:hypothetical protein
VQGKCRGPGPDCRGWWPPGVEAVLWTAEASTQTCMASVPLCGCAVGVADKATCREYCCHSRVLLPGVLLHIMY